MNNDSLSKIALRQATHISYPDNLPVSLEISRIKQLVSANQVVIICGETGSGKTTQLPKMLFELGYADSDGIIGHTQPRRVAAKTIARRIGDELNNHELVGYKIRFQDKTKPGTCIKLMTDGILLQEIRTDKYLRRYSALIIDEAHERSLNIDFILGYLKTILNKRPDLKIIITSATIDNAKLSRFFYNAPVIDVEGKTYPVDIIYQPLNEDSEKVDLNQAIYMAVKSCLAVESGNILIFLPGEREIKDCISYLKRSNLKIHQILPLFSRQNEADQNKIFATDGYLKIIVTTNVAETSLTIPGIRFVIDSGVARVKRYNFRNKVEQLQLENISIASCKQRAGRSGRVSHGMCIRLFSEADYKTRPEFTDPEILRSNLANVILKLINFKLGDPQSFPFLDMPEDKAFSDGFKTLFQLQALTIDKQITPLGSKISQIPIDASLARIIIAGVDFNCLTEILIIVAYLAISDPREYPIEVQQLSRERHQQWIDKKSDFIAILNLWDWYHTELAHKKSRAKLLEKCRYNFVSFIRLRDWHELYGQLKEVINQPISLAPASYQQIHQALLSGLLNNIGQKDLVENFYRGTNSKKFLLHPNSMIDKAKWVVSANLTQTTRLYGRTNAYIEPLWVVPLTGHLVKYTYTNEHWDKERGEVVAIEATLLSGLVMEKKKVAFGHLDCKLAREIFIKEGMISGELSLNYNWLKHNNNVIKNIEKLEDKLRSSLAIMEDELFTFYDEVLPQDICDIRSFDLWCKTNEDNLKLNQKEFITRFDKEVSGINLYPDFILSGGEKIRLKYIFNPESSIDGVTALIYLNQLNRININTFDWLVPGLIRDKILRIIKALPKNIRISLNPVNDLVTDFLDKYSDTELELASVFSEYLLQQKNLPVRTPDINGIQLPKHLNFHFIIFDGKEQVDSGDDLAKLKLHLAPKMKNLVKSLSTKHEIADVKGWIEEFKSLLEEVKFKRFNHEVSAYISLIVKNDQVNLTVVDELATAKLCSQKGLLRLIRYQLLAQIKYLEQKQFINFKQSSLYLTDIYTAEQLLADSINQIVRLSVDLSSFPQNQEEYNNLADKSQSRFTINTALFAEGLFKLAHAYHQLKLKLDNHPLQAQIELQLDDLIYPEFLKHTGFRFLEHYPRYLQAIIYRLDKFVINSRRDKELQLEIDILYEAWYNYVDKQELTNQTISPAIYNFKYRIEELRVSLFAQELKTPYPVSLKRLWRELEDFPGFRPLK